MKVRQTAEAAINTTFPLKPFPNQQTSYAKCIEEKAEIETSGWKKQAG